MPTWDSQKKREYIIEHFPSLPHDGFNIVGPPSYRYNCVALANGVSDGWWSHKGDYKWGPDRSGDVASVVTTLRLQGFDDCEDTGLEDGIRKVAIMAKEGRWTHVAVQQQDGSWLSKLGANALIRHHGTNDLDGPEYGVVTHLMARSEAVFRPPLEAAHLGTPTKRRTRR